MARVVLVTGVSRYLGGKMARLLTEDPSVERVIGVDVVTPAADIGGADFVRADIRNPIIGKVIATAEVDTVVHMGVIATPRQAVLPAEIFRELGAQGLVEAVATSMGFPVMVKPVHEGSSIGMGRADDPMAVVDPQLPADDVTALVSLA